MQAVQQTQTVNQSTDRRRFVQLGMSVLLSLGFSFNLFVFGPVEAYIGNATDFWFGLDAVLPAILVCFACFFLLPFAVCRMLRGRAREIAHCLLFSATVALYVQGNFLAGGYPILDGEAIDWGTMVGKGVINTVIWVVIFALPLAIWALRKNAAQLCLRIGALVILGLEVVTLGTLFATTQMPNGIQCYLSTEDMFDLSAQENVVVVLSDTFEASYMRRALEENPALENDLKDFIFYENTTGVSSLTYLSMSTLMTGEIFPVGADAVQGMRACFSQTDFYDVMHAAGYEVRYYTESNYMSPDQVGMIDNLVAHKVTLNREAKTSVSKLLYKFAFFRYAPHFMKPQFVVDTAAFGQAQALTDQPVYVPDDIQFDQDVRTRGFQTNREKKQYVLYHLNGVHAPYQWDRNLQRATYTDEVPYEDRRYEQALGQLQILKDVISQLKQAGVYDRTTLIFTADHGHQNRFNPVFMVKPAHADRDFALSQAPISMAEDYIPFLEDLAQGRGDQARLYQIPEDLERERYVYMFYSNGGYGSYNDSRSTIAVRGAADDLDGYEIIRDEYNDTGGKKKAYRLGDAIDFDPSAPNAVIQGVFYKEPYSRTATMDLQLAQEPPGDLDAHLKIDRICHGDQTLIVRAGETELFRQTLSPGADHVDFAVPAGCIQDRQLTLTFEFPDTVKRPDDTEGLPWFFFESFAFDTLTLSAAS